MPEFNFEIVKDPRIFQENRLNAHSDHEWYVDETNEESGRSDCKYSLNGSYRFHYAENFGTVIKGFEKNKLLQARNWLSFPVKDDPC